MEDCRGEKEKHPFVRALRSPQDLRRATLALPRLGMLTDTEGAEQGARRDFVHLPTSLLCI